MKPTAFCVIAVMLAGGCDQGDVDGRTLRSGGRITESDRPDGYTIVEPNKTPDPCQLTQLATDVARVRVDAVGESRRILLSTQTRPYSLTPVSITIAENHKGGLRSGQTVQFLGSIAANGFTAVGRVSLGEEGYLFTMQEGEEKLAMLQGWFWQTEVDVWKNMGLYATEPVQGDVLLKQIQAGLGDRCP